MYDVAGLQSRAVLTHSMAIATFCRKFCTSSMYLDGMPYHTPASFIVQSVLAALRNKLEFAVVYYLVWRNPL